MKKLTIILPLALLLCFTVGCQDKEAMAELEEFRAQAEIEEQNKALVRKWYEELDKGNLDKNDINPWLNFILNEIPFVITFLGVLTLSEGLGAEIHQEDFPTNFYKIYGMESYRYIDQYGREITESTFRLDYYWDPDYTAFKEYRYFTQILEVVE